MEFWGAKVKCGSSVKVKVRKGQVLHLSQACLDKVVEDSKETVILHITVDGEQRVVGALCSNRVPQQTFDLVLDKKFKISHTSKNSSVFFSGYRTKKPIYDHIYSKYFDSEDEKGKAKKKKKAVVMDSSDSSDEDSSDSSDDEEDIRDILERVEETQWQMQKQIEWLANSQKFFMRSMGVEYEDT